MWGKCCYHRNIIKETFEQAGGSATEKRRALANKLKLMSMEEKWHKDLEKFTLLIMVFLPDVKNPAIIAI